jgi:hypothetical protein
MDVDEKIQSHIVSVWRESRKFFSIGGKEGMLVLTNKHLMFIHKTESKVKWWKAIVARQALMFLKSKNIMIRHDGYNEENLRADMEDKRNLVLAFDDIKRIEYEEKGWGSILDLEYKKDGKAEKFQFSIVQDWVKYPAKDPTKFMRVDWEPFVRFIKERRNIIDK